MRRGGLTAISSCLRIVAFVALALCLAGMLGRVPAGAADRVSQLTITTRTGAHRFTVEEAVTETEREQGLMYRHDLPDDRGMLFVFPKTEPVVFWMKNTPISLDMLFIRADGTLAGVAANAKPMSQDMIASPEAVRYVLELKGGMTAQIGASPGDRVTHRLIRTTGN